VAAVDEEEGEEEEQQQQQSLVIPRRRRVDRDEVSAGGGEVAKINGPIILGKAVTLRTPSD